MHEAYHEQQLILIASTAIILLLIILFVAALLIQHKRKFAHRQQIHEMQSQYEKTQLQAELKIQEETFKAISQNLHDNIGSNISTAMLLLYKDQTMNESEVETNRKEAISMLDKIVDDLKNIARSLNPSFLNEIGLNEAIGLRIHQLERTKKYEIRFNVNNPPLALDTQKQVILYYIFQESLNNILKHAKATEIKINLNYGADQLKLEIKDNGKGIESISAREDLNGKGSGLLNMKQHAAMINARLNIESGYGNGTKISLEVPHPYQQSGSI